VEIFSFLLLHTHTKAQQEQPGEISSFDKNNSCTPPPPLVLRLFVSLFLCAHTHTHKAQIATNRNLQASLLLCMMGERFLERVLQLSSNDPKRLRLNLATVSKQKKKKNPIVFVTQTRRLISSSCMKNNKDQQTTQQQFCMDGVT
jgi:hypothetical protein